MIVDLPSTTTAAVAAKLVRLRADTGVDGAVRACSPWSSSSTSPTADAAIETANRASRQHPCRIIVVVAGNKRGASRLDAQIRLGGDAGGLARSSCCGCTASSPSHGRAVVTPLLLADSPIVAWWPDPRPDPAVRRPDRGDGRSAGSPTPPSPARRRAPCCAGCPRATPTATPTWPGRGSRCGAACSPRRSTSRPTSRSPASPSSRPPTPPRATCWPAGWRCGCAAR